MPTHYSTEQDLIDRFGEVEIAQLTNRSGVEVIDDSVLGRAQDDADAEIDGYLARRYKLPLAQPFPPVLVRLACGMVRYFLFKDGTPEVVRKNYEDAVSLLKKMGNGDVVLAGAAPLSAAVATNASDVVTTSGGGARRAFDASLLGFR